MMKAYYDAIYKIRKRGLYNCSNWIVEGEICGIVVTYFRRGILVFPMSTALVISSWGYSFKEQSIAAENGDYAELGRAPGKLSPEHDGEDVLSGNYDGTTFTIPLIMDNFPGMSRYPSGIHYGESSNYVWVYTHSRAMGGTTLIDVKTGKGVFGAWGHLPAVSPDKKRIAYTINGRWRLFGQACVQDYVVYPIVYRLTETGGREPLTGPLAPLAYVNRPENYPETPQMEIRHHPEWLDDDSMCFVHYDHPRMADLLRDPSIKTQWFVRVDGVGDGFTTNSVRVRRAELSEEEMELLDELDRQRQQNRSLTINWPHEKMAQLCDARLQAVTAESFSQDPLDPEEYPILPKGLISPIKSPDGKHTLSIGVAGEETDTDSSIEIQFDGQHVSLESLWPLNRLLGQPRWVNNYKAEMVLQTNWYGKILYGAGEPNHVLVTVGVDDGSTQPVLRTEAVSEEKARWMLEH